MTKTLMVCIITCSKYYNRVASLLGTGNLLSGDIKILSEETNHYEYKFNDAVISTWYEGLSAISPGLLENYALSNNLDSSAHLDKSGYPHWMKPRSLTGGDLSVISKHKRALESFLFSADDYVVVLEDDAILEAVFITSLKSICNHLSFDYLDFAGGDNLHCDDKHVRYEYGFEFEYKLLRSTRTACGYVCSRRAALAIIRELEKPYMPIDWSISVALSRLPTDCQVFWLKSPIASHGSSVGLYRSWRNES